MTVLQIQNSLRILADCVNQMQITRAQVIACNERMKKLHRDKERNRKLIRRPRQYWMEPGRTGRWFLNFQLGISPNRNWERNFRFSRRNFDLLCNILGLYIERRDSRFRNPPSPPVIFLFNLLFCF